MQFTDSKARPLPAVTQDVATFLLVRGDYAWLGYSWIGCTSGTKSADDMSPRPAELDEDYGTPVDASCSWNAATQTATRAWTKADVSFDCSAWEGSIKKK